MFTDSSTRAWIVTDFGCLGGALMIAMPSPCSSFAVLSDILSYRIPDSLRSARPKHELRLPAARGGSDPPSPEGSGRTFAARWGHSPLLSWFCRAPLSCPLCRIFLLLLL